MELRLATRSDMPALMAIVRKVVPRMQAAGNPQWTDLYPNEEYFGQDIARGHLWVAEEAGRVAGVIALTEQSEAEYAQAGLDVDEPAVVTHRLAVDPDFGGRGVAAILLEQADVVARERGVRALRIDTSGQNLTAQRLFVRCGYRFAGSISLAVAPGIDVRLYEKRI